MFERSRSLQIYVKPGIKEDDILIGVWEAAKKLDRPQDVFRSMLRAGLMAMLESGELPESIIDECDLDIILEKRMRRKNRKGGQEQPSHVAANPYQAPLPIPAPWPHAAPAMHPAPVYAPMPAQPHQAHEMPVYAPSAPRREEAPAPVPAQPRVEQPAPSPAPAAVKPKETADENKPKAPQGAGSKVNRMKDLM